GRPCAARGGANDAGERSMAGWRAGGDGVWWCVKVFSLSPSPLSAMERGSKVPVMTGGQALVRQMKAERLDTIFGLPGVQLDWAFDAIYDERDHFRVIHTRHEQATAYMADGFARSTG